MIEFSTSIGLEQVLQLAVNGTPCLNFVLGVFDPWDFLAAKMKTLVMELQLILKCILPITACS